MHIEKEFKRVEVLSSWFPFEEVVSGNLTPALSLASNLANGFASNACIHHCEGQERIMTIIPSMKSTRATQRFGRDDAQPYPSSHVSAGIMQGAEPRGWSGRRSGEFHGVLILFSYLTS